MAHLKVLLLLALFFLPGVAWGQQAAVTRKEGTIAQKPACTSAQRGFTYSANDAISTTDCTVGGGAFINFCVCDGTTYVDYAAGGSVGGAGTVTSIKQTDVLIGGTNTVALDLSNTDFTCAESPINEINCSIKSEIARDTEITSAITAHNNATNVHGVTNTTLLLKGGTLTDARFCTYDAAATEIDCNSTGGGGGSGTLTTIKEDNTIVGTGSTIVLDFLGADFDCSELPAAEINCVISAALARDTEVTSAISTHNSATNVHGVANTTLLLSQSAIGTTVQAFDSDLTDISNNTYPASRIPFTPTGTIGSTNVQDAIAEAASESGPGGAGITTVKEDNTNITTNATALDFLGADFDCTELPTGEVNCSIAPAIARDTEVSAAVSAHNSSTNVHGITNTALLLKGGTLTSGQFCTYDGANAEIDCATAAAAGGITTIKEDNAAIGAANKTALDFAGVDFDCGEFPTGEVNCSIAPALTRDIEWNTESALQTAWGGVNILLSTEINTSQKLADILGDETGTSGGIVRATNPTITNLTATLRNSSGALPTTVGDIRFDYTNHILHIGNGTAPETFIPTGTTVDGRLCTYDSAAQEIDCNTLPSGGTGTMTTIKENNVAVGANSTTLDFFGDDFDCSEGPVGEINCFISTALARMSQVTSAIATHESDEISVHGITNTANLLETSHIGVSVQAFDSDLSEVANNSYPALKIPFTATGTISATNVQAAIEEVAAEAGTGSGTGTINTIKVGNIQLGGSTITTLDFLDADFDCTETPPNEINCSVDPLIARDIDVTNAVNTHNSSTNVHGIANTSLLLAGGTLNDTQLCSYDLATSKINCTTPPAGLSSPLTIPGNNGYIFYEPATEGESEWQIGPNHDGAGDDDDCYEVRQSATPGANVRFSICADGTISSPSSVTDNYEHEIFESENNGGGSILLGINGNIANTQKDCRFDANGEYPDICLKGVTELTTLSGVAIDSTNLGTFTGTTIADNSTIKTALQAVETSVETKQTSGQNFLVTKTTSVSYTLGTTDSREPYGGVVYVTGAATISLPLVQPGMSFTVITIGAFAVSIDPNIADTITLDGSATGFAAGDKITNTLTAGDMAVCTYLATNSWYCASGSNDGDPWTDTN